MLRPILLLLDLYTWVIVLRALLSWVVSDPRNQLMIVLHQLTEPVLRPLRALVPPERLGGLDLSPILAIVALQLIKRLLIGGL